MRLGDILANYALGHTIPGQTMAQVKFDPGQIPVVHTNACVGFTDSPIIGCLI